MPMNGYNLGSDVSVVFNLPQGPVTFANVTNFTAKQITKRVESAGIDGVTRYQEIPAGWEGTLDIDRANPNMDNAIAYLERLYFSGANVPASVIGETIKEASGASTSWQYNGVMFKFDDHGSWKGDDKVTQRLGWVASSRQSVQ